MISIPSVAAVLASFGILSGVVWQGYELKQEVASNTSYRQLQEYQILRLIKEDRDLTYEEWIKFCNVGTKLRVFIKCPSRYRERRVVPIIRRNLNGQ